MSFETYSTANRRLALLLALGRVSDRKLNTSILQREASVAGHNVSRDVIRGDIVALEELGAVIRHVTEGWTVAELAERGADHIAGRTILPGVERPALRRG